MMIELNLDKRESIRHNTSSHSFLIGNFTDNGQLEPLARGGALVRLPRHEDVQKPEANEPYPSHYGEESSPTGVESE